MKTFLTLAIGLILAACLTPETPVLPEQEPLFRIDRVDTFTGIEATREALEAVSRELHDPNVLATGAARAGQTMSERRALLADMTEALEKRLREHQSALPAPGACVVHRNPEFKTRFTTAWIGTGEATVASWTETDRTTQIRNSVYSEVGRGFNPNPEPGRGLTTMSDLACGEDLYTNVRMTFWTTMRDHRRSFWLYAETAHILPTVTGSMSWTTDTATCTMEVPEISPGNPFYPGCT